VGEALVKSDTYYTMTDRALGAASETPPEPFESWMDNMLGLAAETQENAQSAEEAKEKAEAAVGRVSHIGINGNWYEWDAASGQFVDTGVKAQGPAGPAGPAGADGSKGADGEAGPKGEKGEDGNSGVYVGSGDMPEWCNVQVDPNGDPTDMSDIVDLVMEALPTYHGEVEDV
jgi:hypothetical protein